jgi:hypothetical protein
MFGIDDAISAGSDLIKTIVNKIAPDANIEVQGKIETALRELQSIHEKEMSQLDINKTEAQHPSVFVAGWRPFIGWVGGMGLGYELVFKPVFNGILMFFGVVSPFAGIDINLLQTMIGGLLGLGLARSYEKTNNVDTKKMVLR